MVRISSSQVPTGAVDNSGLSVTVAKRRADNPRYGAAYDLTHLAAAVPIYFHPLTATDYVMVFNRRWHTATPAPEDPGSYTDFTDDSSPGWVRVSIPSGQRSLLNGSYAIPLRTAYDSVQVTDALSRSGIYLYLLMSATRGDFTTGVVSHWFYNSTTASFGTVAEEEVTGIYVRPTSITDTAWVGLTDEQRASQGSFVVFDRGLQIVNPHLVVFGTDTEGRVFQARKPWGRIGTNLVTRPENFLGTQRRGVPEDPRWTYWTGTGWTADPVLAAPLVDQSGAVITTLGPISVTTYRDRNLMSAVIAQDDERLAQVYVQRHSQQWVPHGTVSLGSVADDSYLDGLRWQQQLLPSSDSPEMISSLNEVAIPYLYSVRQDVEQPIPEGSPEGTLPVSVSAIDNNWALWSIARPVVLERVVGTPIDANLTVVMSAQGIMDATGVEANLPLSLVLHAHTQGGLVDAQGNLSVAAALDFSAGHLVRGQGNLGVTATPESSAT